MTILVTVTTTADPIRPVMCWRVELENEDLLKEWLDQRALLMSERETWREDKPSYNTSVTIAKGDGWVETKQYRLKLDELQRVLAFADGLERQEMREGSGRYPSRVLVLTTSKDRRTGATRRY